MYMFKNIKWFATPRQEVPVFSRHATEEMQQAMLVLQCFLFFTTICK